MFSGPRDAAAQAQAASPLKIKNTQPKTDEALMETAVETVETVDAYESKIQESFAFILEHIQNPVDAWAIAATLESRGLRDIDAVEKFGKADIFDLAEELYRRCRRHLRTEELISLVQTETAGPVELPAIMAICHKRGLTDQEARENFAQPDLAALAEVIHRRCRPAVAVTGSDARPENRPASGWAAGVRPFIQTRALATPAMVYGLSLLTLVCALGIYIYAAPAQGAALASSTIFSLLISGGFVQAMSRLSLAFYDQDRPGLAQLVCARLIRRGQLAVFLAGAIVALASYFIGFFGPAWPVEGVLIGLIDYFLLSLLWLFLAVSGALRQRRALIHISGGFTASLLLWLLWPHYYGIHWLGLTATTGLAFWHWRRLPRLTLQEIERASEGVDLPAAPFTTFLAGPYVVLAVFYGLYWPVVYLSGGPLGRVTLPLLPGVSVLGLTGLTSLLPLIFMACLSIVLTVLMLEAALYGQQPPLAKDEAERIGRFARFYGRGVSFALPMAIQIISLLTFGFALWASLDFDELAATTVAIGTISSFIVTSGFVQAIGRLGLLYGEQESYMQVREALYRLVRSAMATVLCIGGVWYILNLIIPLFPQLVILISLAYYFLLAALWIFLAVLYVLRQRLAIVIVTTIGLVTIGFVLHIFEPGVHEFVRNWTPGLVELVLEWVPASFDVVVWLLLRIMALLSFLGFMEPYYRIPWNIYAAHWIGLGVTTLLAFVGGHRRLFEAVHWLNQQKTGPVAALKRAKLPPVSIVSYAVAPYFVYGLLYFGYLFLDRLIGWSTGELPLPLLIWFRTPYELGLDWAALSLLLTIAMLEYTVNEFGKIIVSKQETDKALQVKTVEKARSPARSPGPGGLKEKSEPALSALNKKSISAHPFNPDFQLVAVRQIKKHNDFFFRFYLRQLFLLIAIALVSIFVTYYGVLWFRRFDHIQAVRDFFASPVTFSVFYWSVIGYNLLAWAMLNNVFFFFLARPGFTLRALSLALGLNLLIGFILSRVFVYWYSVIGMTGGTVIIVILTTWTAIRVFRKLDYYYYSAY